MWLCLVLGQYNVRKIDWGNAMKNFVEDNKFVLIVTFLEILPSKVSKKFFDAAEFSGSSYYSSSFYLDRF